MESNQKGEIAKLRVELRAAEKGWTSSRTVEGARYDLILDDGNKLYRVQVKYGGGKSSNSKGAAAVSFKKSNKKLNGKYKCKNYSSDEIDAILTYLPKADKICWITPEFFHDKPAINLRYEPPKNGQSKGIHLVEDFVW